MSKKLQQKKTDAPVKHKAPKQKMEVYPEYQNDDDIPIWSPDQPGLNKQKQNKLKKDNKNKKQQQQDKGSKKKRVEQEIEEIDEPQQMEEQYFDENQDDNNDQELDYNQGEQMEQENFQEQVQGEQQGQQGQGDDLQQMDFEDGGEGEVQPSTINGKSDYSMINMKIQEILAVLGSFQRLAEKGKSRKDYIEELKSHLQSYYNYNSELIDHFLTFLNPNELIQFFEANETQRPLTIRINTLKTRRKQLAESLIQRGVDLDKLADWSKVGIKIYQTKVPIGATPEYLAGHYMLQSASSLLPVLALDPQTNQKILDLAAAPGGKTTYVAQLMKNTGVIFANDVKKQRLRALQFNVQRLGISNVIVTNYDGRKINKVINNFDRVLLDAPCTGLGIISKDQSIKANKVLMDIRKHSQLQKQLILAAIDSARPHGVIVYSTCSVSPLQNQQVVNYALKKRHVKLVDIDVDVGEPGVTKYIQKRYHPDLARTRRINPHIHNMDGFYVAKFVKLAHGAKIITGQKEDQEQVVEDFVAGQQEEQETKPKKIKTKKISKNKTIKHQTKRKGN